MMRLLAVCHTVMVDNAQGESRINELVGVLECAKIELYRRIAAPYEDDKSRINGDVYFG